MIAVMKNQKRLKFPSHLNARAAQSRRVGVQICLTGKSLNLLTSKAKPQRTKVSRSPILLESILVQHMQLDTILSKAITPVVHMLCILRFSMACLGLQLRTIVVIVHLMVMMEFICLPKRMYPLVSDIPLVLS